MRSDTRVRDDIVAELEYDPAVEAAGIGVAVEDGVATLIGKVPAYPQKAAAEAAAKRVRGVRAVVEQLEVELPQQSLWRDEEIASHIADLLAWSFAEAAEALMVEVENGWVTLTGEAGSRHERMQAGRAVGELRGVVGITNRIAVRPPTGAADLHRTITAALHRAAHLDASAIAVSVEGGEVVLSGAVKDLLDREIAEQAAWTAPGVVRVVDHLRIVG